MMQPQPFETLLRWTLDEYERHRSIFGLPAALFYTPRPDAPYVSSLFGHPLATPIGPAAGPHTQLAQNIVCAWLCGGRFIELKTVQIMDELDVPRPCIDMADEGYNVEWSQELRLAQSADEYIKAWALVHILHRLLGFAGPVGTIFNMSVGYNLAGIQSPPVTRFMERLADASADLAAIRATLQEHFPRFADVDIPTRLSDNVTLSTMHGCPPDEIERIGRYLLEERGLHTTVKLNPTLLGREAVLGILHDDLGYREIVIPEAVFAHDLQWEQAIGLIRTLQGVAAGRGLVFGVKLSNTLAVANHRGVLPGEEMYMSGRALYPVTMNLFHRLAREFGGNLNVSYSAGADAQNVATILSCGARPVTAASDLLKPGGYGRLRQYLENLEVALRAQGASSLEDFAADGLSNLEHAAAEARRAPRYQKAYYPFDRPKVESPLGRFDCIVAPCVEQCPVAQDVPEYAWLIAQGEYDRALEVILSRNPLPTVTGYVCTHLCQTRCTRNDYEQAVGIRALKRFAAERGKARLPVPPRTPHKAAVIGSGPAGLAAAFFLALSGVQVTLFEARARPGGMLALAPAFRLPHEVVQADIRRILSLGVELLLSHPVDTPPEKLLDQGFDAVYVACGFQRDAPLDIPGIEGEGLYHALHFLRQVAQGQPPALGRQVLVIGGGNTAMDAARTARRLTGAPVTVVYRRTRAEMPAEAEEVADLLAEGNILLELVSPTRLLLEEGRVIALECRRNELGAPDADGRRRPVPIPGSDFRLSADSVIVAIGQAPEPGFLEGSRIVRRPDGRIVVDPQSGQAGPGPVYAGGDVVRGPETIIAACADGRRAAAAICRQMGIPFLPPPARPARLSPEDIVHLKESRARREERHEPETLPPAQRSGFALVEQTLTEEAARREAGRCLQCSALCDKCVEVCPNRANQAYLVQPVAWRLPLLSCREGWLVVAGEETFQVQQTRQILHIADLCNECGNCATFCVHPGRPYADKPRLFLAEAAFLQESDKALFISGHTIRRREGGQESRLTMSDGHFAFENTWVQVVLSADFTVQEALLKQPFAAPLSLRQAAEMAVVLRGVKSSLGFLPV